MLLRSISIFLTFIFDSLAFPFYLLWFLPFPDQGQAGLHHFSPIGSPPMALPGLEIMTPSGFSFAGLVEVDPRNTKRGLLLQDRVGRAEPPAFPVREHLLLDGFGIGSMEGQDVRLGVPDVLFQSDAAVDSQAGATDNLLPRRAEPSEVVLA